MSSKFYAHIDMTKHEIQNAVIQNLASAPSSPVAGLEYFDTVLGYALIYNGTTWTPLYESVAKTAYTANSVITATTASTPVATTLSSGTLLGNSGSGPSALNAASIKTILGITPSDVSGFDTQVRTNRLDQMATPTATVSMGSQKISNLLDPTSAQDAATKAYVDATAQGLTVKDAVRVATTASLAAYSRTGNVITASGNGALAAIDGVTLVANDRLLLKNGAAGADNGLYTVTQVGTVGTPFILTRTTDADVSAEVKAGMFVFITEGSTNADTGWTLTTDNPITLNTTSLAFAQFSGAGTVTAGAGLTKTGSTIDVGAGTGITVNADDIQISTSWAGQTALTTLGTITTGTWSATTIAVNKGGTGMTSYAVGDIIYASATGTLSALADVATGNALISGGVSTAPSYGKIGLTTHISGTLAVGNGGTGATTLTSNGVLLGNTTSAVTATAAGSADNILRVPGAGGTPAFGSIDLSKTAAVGTSILAIANGGTGASTAAAARTALSAAGWYVTSIGNGSLTSFTVTHSLGTRDVKVEVYDAATYETVYVDVARTTTSAVTISGFQTAPASNAYRVLVFAAA